MRNATLTMLVIATLFAAACGSAADTVQPSSSPEATATEAPSSPSIADVVANATGSEDATDGGSPAAIDDARGGTDTTPGDATVSTRATQLKIDSVERQRLVQAIQTTESLDAFEFEWSMVMPGFPELPGGLSFGGNGAVDPVNERFAMTIDFSELFGALASAEDVSAEDLALIETSFGDEPMQMRYVDGTMYMSWPLFGLMLGADTTWIALEAPTGTEGFGALPTGSTGIANPLDATAFLQDVWGIEEVGRETVRGVDTTHYRGVIDIVEAMDALSPDDLAALEADLDGADLSDLFGEFPVDVWIDDNNVMRRFSVEIDFSGFGGAGATAESLIGSMMMSYEFFNIGGDISIEAPPANEVTTVSDAFFLEGFDLAS